jgi:hypothetical protein
MEGYIYKHKDVKIIFGMTSTQEQFVTNYSLDKATRK